MTFRSKSSLPASFSSVLAVVAISCAGDPSTPHWQRNLLERSPDSGLGAAPRGDPRGEPLTVPEGAAVVYRVEHRWAAVLEVESSGPGSVELELAKFLPGKPASEPRGARSQAGPARIELPASDSGEVTEVVLRSRSGDVVIEALTLHEQRDPPPPILFVSADTLNAKHLSAYGYERPTTPNLERFAQEAVTFERCMANGPWTVTSYASQLSGHYPSACLPLDSEEESRGQLLKLRIPARRWTLPEALRAAGYRTAAFTGNPNFRLAWGFDQGFDVYEPRPLGAEGRLREHFAGVTAWLDETSGSPPFLFLNAMDTHGPYAPPDGHAGRFQDDGLLATHRNVLPAPAGQSFGFVPRYQLRNHDPFPESVPLDDLTAAYDEEVAALDEAIGEVFDAWKRRGLWDASVVIVTADHGESLGEHEWFFNHGVLYEDSARVPLLVKLPHGTNGGTRRTETVQLVDLYPTLLELAGLSPERRGLHGRSLVPALEGGTLEPRPVVTQGGVLGGAAIEAGSWRLVRHELRLGTFHAAFSHPSVRRWLAQNHPEVLRGELPAKGFLGNLEATFGGSTFELYDVRNDPGELVDLGESHPDRVAELARLLDIELARAEGLRTSDGVPDLELDDESRAELEALGYLGDE